MSIDDFVSVGITSGTASPSKPGFGVPLFAAQKVPAAFVNRVRTYTDQPSMVTDGFGVNDEAYLWAGECFAQTPRPPKVKIGRRAIKTTQSVKLKVISATQNDTYSIDIITQAGVKTNIPYTVPGAATTTTVATAIAALIAAVSGFGATSSTDTITVTATGGAGFLQRFQNWTANFYLTDASADPGIATDLNAILIEDSDWYGLSIDSASKAEILAAAGWAESNKKLFVQHTSDSDTGDAAVSTDVMSQVKSSAYAFTGLIYSGNDTKSYAGGGLQAGRFAGTPTPGNETWALKTIVGVKVDKLAQTFIDQVKTKLGMVYVVQSSINVTQAGDNGNTGAGDWIDVRRYLDWLKAEIQARSFGFMVSAAKVPMTDAGGDAVGAVILGALQDGEKNGGGATGTSSVTVPKISALDPATRKQRKLSGITFGQILAGAIHSLVINGVVSS